VSKIVIGALTAAAWFALSYVAARADSVAGQVCDHAKYVSSDAGRADSGAAVHGPDVVVVR
jgi:hypothetical protein